MAAGPHAETIPASYGLLGELILEVFDQEEQVSPAMLRAVTAKAVYAEFVSTPPPPKIVVKYPQAGWRRIWGRLNWAGIPESLVDRGFAHLHDILPTEERRCRLGLTDSASCRACGAAVGSSRHEVAGCGRTADVWGWMVRTIQRKTGVLMLDGDLARLDLPVEVAQAGWEKEVVLAVLALIDWAWETREEARALTVEAFEARLRRRVPSKERTLFEVS